MTYELAYKRLLALAKGKYCTMEFSHTTFASGRLETKCRFYVDLGPGKPGVVGKGALWSHALTNLEREILMHTTAEQHPVETLPTVEDTDYNTELEASNDPQTATD